VPPQPFAIYTVPDDAPTKAEAMGTKQKFWFSRGGEPWLFKTTRPGQGEHWAEVLAAALAEKLSLPHARYELARWKGSVGVVTPRLMPKEFDLVHGNELLAELDATYPPEGARYVQTRQHTIEAVRTAIGAKDVKPPLGWTPPPGIETACDVFAGYLLLDAWIGNTDRHHENWALVVNLSKGERHLAPTFDHASSLGAHETDVHRTSRLESADPGFRVEGYVQRSKARSALYREPGDARPLALVEAFQQWSQSANARPWLEALNSIGADEIRSLVARLPEAEASGPARAFAQAILEVNSRRILEAL
jgi:hypothetical protein